MERCLPRKLRYSCCLLLERKQPRLGVGIGFLNKTRRFFRGTSKSIRNMPQKLSTTYSVITLDFYFYLQKNKVVENEDGFITRVYTTRENWRVTPRFKNRSPTYELYLHFQRAVKWIFLFRTGSTLSTYINIDFRAIKSHISKMDGSFEPKRSTLLTAKKTRNFRSSQNEHTLDTFPTDIFQNQRTGKPEVYNSIN